MHKNRGNLFFTAEINAKMIEKKNTIFHLYKNH